MKHWNARRMPSFGFTGRPTEPSARGNNRNAANGGYGQYDTLSSLSASGAQYSSLCDPFSTHGGGEKTIPSYGSTSSSSDAAIVKPQGGILGGVAAAQSVRNNGAGDGTAEMASETDGRNADEDPVRPGPDSPTPGSPLSPGSHCFGGSGHPSAGPSAWYDGCGASDWYGQTLRTANTLMARISQEETFLSAGKQKAVENECEETSRSIVDEKAGLAGSEHIMKMQRECSDKQDGTTDKDPDANSSQSLVSVLFCGQYLRRFWEAAIRPC